MANPLRAATIFPSRAVMQSMPGPLTEQFGVPLDYPRLYRFAVNDTGTDNGVRILSPSGGGAGNWLLVDDQDGMLPPVDVLADLPVLTSAAAGMRCYVRSRRSIYQHSGSAWVRTTDCDPSWALSGDVYVDYDAGSDDGEGTEGDPLATVPEALARLGRNPVNSASFFWVHVTGDATETNWSIDARTVATQSITISAEPTVLLTTTVTVTAWTTARGTMTGGSSLASYAAASASTDGKMWRVSGGDRDGLWGTFRLHQGAGVVEYEVGAYQWTPGGDEPQTGDTIEVLDLASGPDTMTITADTTVFFAGFAMLTGAHALAVAPGAACWITSCLLGGGCDAQAGAFLSVVACGGAGMAVRCEEPGGYLEVHSGRVGGINVHTLSHGRLGSLTIEDRINIDTGGRVIHQEGHVCTENTGAGPIIELYSGASWVRATAAGSLIGHGAVGGSNGVIWVHPGASFRSATAPAITVVSGTEINVGGVAKTFSAVPTGYIHPNNGATISAAV